MALSKRNGIFEHRMSNLPVKTSSAHNTARLTAIDGRQSVSRFSMIRRMSTNFRSHLVCMYYILDLLLLLLAVPASADLPSETPRTGKFETSLPLFSRYADQGEIVRRMFHLSVSQQLFAHAQSMGKELSGQTIDPGLENFHVFVPGNYDPERSYGLFVWVSAREEVTVPEQWHGVFTEYDIIFVAADKSGNKTNDLDRRVPLALHAMANMQHSYNIDKNRIYIGGFSGGGRVASKIAAGYGDLFSGAYYFVGSDAIGGKTVPVPDSSVLDDMRRRGRYVFMTGRTDHPTTTATRTAMASYQRLCIFNTAFQIPRMGHGLPNIMWFRRGIEYLESGYLEDARAAEETVLCQATLDQEKNALVESIGKLLDGNDTEGAEKALKQLQLQFGRLSAEEFNQLYSRLSEETEGQ